MGEDGPVLMVAERIDAIVEMNNPGVWILGSPRDQDRTIARQLAAIGHMDENVAGDFSVFNEWHRPAP